MTAADVPGQLDLSGHERTELERRLEELRELEQNERRSAVQRVAHAAADNRQSADELERAVEHARAAGATWQQIADAAGMTRQNAHKRWAGLSGDHDHTAGADGRCTYCRGEVAR